MRAAARLDPAARRIAGYAEGGDGRPAQVEIALDGERALSLIAVSPLTALSRETIAEIGPPPSAACAFSALLPAEAAIGRDGPCELTVSADGACFFKRAFDEPAALARYREGWVMTDSVNLRLTRLRAGTFTGRVNVADGAPPPAIELRLRGERIAEASVAADGDGYALTAKLPPDGLSDGVVVVEFVAEGVTLARYPISAGETLAGDLAAEIASLRAELDHLKTAFRGMIAGGVVTRDERPMIVAEALAHVDALLERRDRALIVDVAEPEGEDDEWEIKG